MTEKNKRKNIVISQREYSGRYARNPFGVYIVGNDSLSEFPDDVIISAYQTARQSPYVNILVAEGLTPESIQDIVSRKKKELFGDMSGRVNLSTTILKEMREHLIELRMPPNLADQLLVGLSEELAFSYTSGRVYGKFVFGGIVNREKQSGSPPDNSDFHLAAWRG